MKNLFKLSCAVAVATMFFSCSKEPIQNGPANDVPEGYTKVYFSAGVDETKAFVGPKEDDKTVVCWTGNEPVNIWYKSSEGEVEKVAATFESFNGRNANFSALIPSDANHNEFYAEVNGVSDGSGKIPFGSYDGNPTTAARVRVAADQNAVRNSFDPAVAAMGARWVYSKSKPNPTLAFKNLTNLLKISVKNETGKTLNKIVLNNDVMIACNNYWDVDDQGYIKIKGSADYSTQINLNGTDIEDGDYYFVISKTNNSKMVLKNMTVSFHFTDGTYRIFSNSAELDMTGYAQCAYIGSFTIKTEDLKNDSTFAPFGTSWGTGAVKNADKGNDGKYVATANNGGVAYFTCSEVNSSGNNIKGKFTFEFYTKDSGTGVLTFNSRGGAAGHTCSVYVNDNKVGDDITYPNNSEIVNVVRELTVSKGDKISIVYNNGSSNAYLFFYFNNASHPITWTKKSAE